MTTLPSTTARTIRTASIGGASEPFWLRATLIAISLGFIFIVLLLPLYVVFQTAFRDGVRTYWNALTDTDTASAIQVTLLAVAIAVPLNMIFGFAAAWSITRFEFRGKRFIVSLIDVPFAVSPVISGMIFILMFGADSVLGAWLSTYGIKVVFALPGIVIATTFVTFPFVARELIPVMQTQSAEQELAALTLGASPWRMFQLVTLPNIKWGLFYGTTLCAARAVGEFGAVSVVSGHIRGETNTLPLHVEVVYNEYHFSAAFAVATLLVAVALITLGAKSVAEWMETNKTLEQKKWAMEEVQ
ncbi:MAG: sulfate ABC transporter permease subunit CysW [Deltaproteobacteria bacterium]|nr:sulfate ABC transporter permease subunit CysW [Deltaproteobacteria bacterium]MBN2672757.1 sulfate ABC transporter permease subunit CysW [Deltaproteobacteria bacterium]